MSLWKKLLYYICCGIYVLQYRSGKIDKKDMKDNISRVYYCFGKIKWDENLREKISEKCGVTFFSYVVSNKSMLKNSQRESLAKIFNDILLENEASYEETSFYIFGLFLDEESSSAGVVLHCRDILCIGPSIIRGFSFRTVSLKPVPFPLMGPGVHGKKTFLGHLVIVLRGTGGLWIVYNSCKSTSNFGLVSKVTRVACFVLL